MAQTSFVSHNMYYYSTFLLLATVQEHDKESMPSPLRNGKTSAA